MISCIAKSCFTKISNLKPTLSRVLSESNLRLTGGELRLNLPTSQYSIFTRHSEKISNINNAIELNQNELLGNCIYEEQLVNRYKNKINEKDNEQRRDIDKWIIELNNCEKIYIPLIEKSIVRTKHLDENISPIMYNLVDISSEIAKNMKNQRNAFIKYHLPSRIESVFYNQEGLYYFYLNKGTSNYSSQIYHALQQFEMYAIYKTDLMLRHINK